MRIAGSNDKNKKSILTGIFKIGYVDFTQGQYRVRFWTCTLLYSELIRHARIINTVFNSN